MNLRQLLEVLREGQGEAASAVSVANDPKRSEAQNLRLQIPILRPCSNPNTAVMGCGIVQAPKGPNPRLACRMRRREFVTLLGGTAVAWPLAARAQTPAKILRVGTVSGVQKSAPTWVAFEQRMAELGYQEGKTWSFDFVPAATEEQIETGYRKLAASGLDILIAAGSEIALKSALSGTRTLPIVMIAIDYDPLARGYVTSLARPSGNVTGVFFQQIELAAKRIQLIKDAFPDRPGATMFWDRLSADQWQAAQNTAATLGLRIIAAF